MCICEIEVGSGIVGIEGTDRFVVLLAPAARLDQNERLAIPDLALIQRVSPRMPMIPAWKKRGTG